MSEFVEVSDRSAKVGSEGRLVIPADVRRQMGLRSGDVVCFVFDTESGDWRISTADTLVARMWANNTGGETSDSAELVRRERTRDQAASIDAERRMERTAQTPWDEAAETERLLAELGLA